MLSIVHPQSLTEECSMPKTHSGCVRFLAGVEAELGSAGIQNQDTWIQKIEQEWTEEMIQVCCLRYGIDYVKPQ